MAISASIRELSSLEGMPNLETLQTLDENLKQATPSITRWGKRVVSYNGETIALARLTKLVSRLSQHLEVQVIATRSNPLTDKITQLQQVTPLLEALQSINSTSISSYDATELILTGRGSSIFLRVMNLFQRFIGNEPSMPDAINGIGDLICVVQDRLAELSPPANTTNFSLKGLMTGANNLLNAMQERFLDGILDN